MPQTGDHKLAGGGKERAAAHGWERLREVGERVLVGSPQRGWAVVILAVSGLVMGGLMMWMQRQTLLASDQVMSETRAVRVPVTVGDPQATARNRESAREMAPRVYVVNEKVLSGLQQSLSELPSAAALVRTVEELPADVRGEYELNASHLIELKRIAMDGPRSVAWSQSVRRLVEQLRKFPLLERAEWDAERDAKNRDIELLSEIAASSGGQRGGTIVPTGAAMAIDSADWRSQRAPSMVQSEAGITETLRGVVLTRLTTGLAKTPTFSLSAAMSQQRKEEAAASVVPVESTYQPGKLIFARGDVLTPEQLRFARVENEEYWESKNNPLARLHDLAVLGLALVFSLGLGVIVSAYAPRVVHSPQRLAMLCGLVVGSLAMACALAIIDPRLIVLACSAPGVLVAMTLAVAYERRVGLVVGSLLTIATCVVLGQPALMCLLGLCGVVVSVRKLTQVRQRHTLILAAFGGAAAVLFIGMAVGLLVRPIDWLAARQALAQSGAAAGAVFMCGFLILGALPLIERAFGVTTGLTLIDLRDPAHPLLRQLQQRAPGTYNHSLNVAALSEAAATAIQADSLMAYVGALYHDVGKMNKPEYFVENQSAGFNRHERLSPAMSLMVIVGHVQDGMELAREYRLPENISHFIESHHGTTLVEYFYHRARKQAEAARIKGEDDAIAPEEIEYRYPGPKPRSREAAILMVCDASESAARTLSDPSPLRIDSLVRAIAHKRLMDGQFDQSELTLRDLTIVIETVSRSLASIYHHRIQYPEQVGAPARATAAVAAGQGGVTRSAS